ncbi:MAG: hypothetical protein M1401_08020 [Chloroflexi bacterium]|nr:hypothetical protein [Chloroflexota bacterium]MCL5108794.1 hypothetical protein [Chloroflexota bacterium]
MFKDELSVSDGSSFILSRANGDIAPGAVHGFFHADTRFLAGLVLGLVGREPVLLTSGTAGDGAAAVYTTNPVARTSPSPACPGAGNYCRCGSSMGKPQWRRPSR